MAARIRDCNCIIGSVPRPFVIICIDPLDPSQATALDCVEEAKAASKKDSCQVLKKIARAPLQSADEPLFRALADSGVTMSFDMKDVELDADFSYPCFPPKEMLQTIAAEGYFHKVLGVPVLYSDHVLPRFWEKYQVLFPAHDLFSAREATDFKRLLPFYVHGD